MQKALTVENSIQARMSWSDTNRKIELVAPLTNDDAFNSPALAVLTAANAYRGSLSGNNSQQNGSRAFTDFEDAQPGYSISDDI